MGAPGLHHATLLIGSAERAESYVRSLCLELGISLLNNPDFLIIRGETFGIDEARNLKALAIHKPLSGKKIFLILADRFTLEAENALLKTLEDPSPDTHFFIASRDETSFLPTFLSRMQVVKDLPPLKSLEDDALSEAKKFLSLSIKKRLVSAKEFSDQGREVTRFLDGLTSLFRSRGDLEAARKVYSVRNFVDGSAANTRLILEHLSVVL